MCRGSTNRCDRVFALACPAKPTNCWVIEIGTGGKVGFWWVLRKSIPMRQEIIVCAGHGFADRWFYSSQSLVVAVSPFKSRKKPAGRPAGWDEE